MKSTPAVDFNRVRRSAQSVVLAKPYILVVVSCVLCSKSDVQCTKINNWDERLFLVIFILCANFNLTVSPYLFFAFNLMTVS